MRFLTGRGGAGRELNAESSDLRELDLGRAIGSVVRRVSMRLGEAAALTGAVVKPDAAGEAAAEVSDVVLRLGDAEATEKGVRMEDEEMVVEVGDEILQTGREPARDETVPDITSLDSFNNPRTC